MRLPRQRFLAPLIAVPVLALGALGCGREDAPDLINGKTKFIQKCALVPRRWPGPTPRASQGPNLDQAFGPARRTGLGEQTVEGVVQEQIALVRRSSTMPPNLVTGADAQDVAAYVAAVAGQPGKDTGAAGQRRRSPKVSNKPIDAKGGKLMIDADPSGALAFAAGKATRQAGTLDVRDAERRPRSSTTSPSKASGGTRRDGQGRRPGRDLASSRPRQARQVRPSCAPCRATRPAA